MRKIFWVTTLVLLAAGLLGQKVLAVGIGVKPTSLNIFTPAYQSVKAEILVVNVTSAPAVYQVYPDDLKKQIIAGPTDFRLEAGGQQIVEIKFKTHGPGHFKTNLSIVARSMAGGGLTPASGVKVPIEITVSGPSIWLLMLVGLVLIGVCSSVYFVLKFKKRAKSN